MPKLVTTSWPRVPWWSRCPRSSGPGLATYGPQLDDLRAALDWAFAPEGHPAFVVALTITAMRLWFQLSLLGECRVRVEHALSYFYFPG